MDTTLPSQAPQDEMDPELDARKRTTSSSLAVRGGTVGLAGPPTTTPRPEAATAALAAGPSDCERPRFRDGVLK
jgi:hypothetical protein